MSPRRPAFTLIELLVVVAIIALLIALILPALGRARFEAIVAKCLAGEHQLALGCYAYATENRGFLPRFDTVDCGRNAWDIDGQFYFVLRGKYGVPHPAFFCPAQPTYVRATGTASITGKNTDPKAWFDNYYDYNQKKRFVRLGYMIWIPRRSGNDAKLYPPAATVSDPDCGGPVNLEDRKSSTNPIITDYTAKAGGQWEERAMHQYRPGVVEVCNQAYADGHALRVPGRKLLWRYTGTSNEENWR